MVKIPSIILAGEVFIVKVTSDPPAVIVLSMVIIFVPVSILSIVAPRGIPVPITLSDTITFATSAAVSVIKPVLTVTVVAVREKFSRPMYKSSLYSTKEVTEPRLSSVSLTETEATEVRVMVPVPLSDKANVEPPAVADSVISSTSGTVLIKYVVPATSPAGTSAPASTIVSLTTSPCAPAAVVRRFDP